jgi:3-oxoacyl-[acyl-carrier protein] reductase
MTLTGRTALVTGGSRGIGRAIVQRLLREGARVVYTHRADHPTVEGAVAVRADHEDPDSVATMFAALPGGTLDILVNNAAAVSQTPIAELDAAEFDRIMTINAKVPLLAMRQAATVLRDNGRIVNISTLNTDLPAAGLALYCASKAALEQITRVAARELGGRGITVNSVAPGATDTDLLRSANPPEALELSVGMTALGRLGRPDDIASVVAFLAGPDSSWITGQHLRATGGLVL